MEVSFGEETTDIFASCRIFLYWLFDEKDALEDEASFFVSFSVEPARSEACSESCPAAACLVDSHEIKIRAHEAIKIGNTFFIVLHPKMIVVTLKI